MFSIGKYVFEPLYHIRLFLNTIKSMQRVTFIHLSWRCGDNSNNGIDTWGWLHLREITVFLTLYKSSIEQVRIISNILVIYAFTSYKDNPITFSY